LLFQLHLVQFLRSSFSLVNFYIWNNNRKHQRFLAFKKQSLESHYLEGKTSIKEAPPGLTLYIIYFCFLYSGQIGWDILNFTVYKVLKKKIRWSEMCHWKVFKPKTEFDFLMNKMRNWIIMSLVGFLRFPFSKQRVFFYSISFASWFFTFLKYETITIK
jgi:hypothetical protein